MPRRKGLSYTKHGGQKKSKKAGKSKKVKNQPEPASLTVVDTSTTTSVDVLKPPGAIVTTSTSSLSVDVITSPAPVGSLLFQIVLGDFNQRDERFDAFSRGNQCTANAAVACIGSSVKDIDTWSSADVNEVLRAGDELYRCSISRRATLNFGYDRHLTAVELYTTVSNIFNFRVRFNVLENDSFYGHLTRHQIDFPNLENALTAMFAIRSCGVITSNAFSVAAIKSTNAYFYFDSHSLTNKGDKCFELNGRAAVMRFASVPDMCRKIVGNLISPEVSENYQVNAYVLTPLEVTDQRFVVAPATAVGENVVDEEPHFSDIRTIIASFPLEQQLVTRIYAAERQDPYKLCIGNLEKVCKDCGAYFFKDENLLCCKKGAISISNIYYPELLRRLLMGSDARAKEFKRQILKYNNMFAFASVGANVQMPSGIGPSVYIVQGMIYHSIRDIFPNAPPKYAQLYFLDTNDATDKRCVGYPGCSRETVLEIDQLLREINPFSATYRTLREVVDEEIGRAAEFNTEIPSVYISVRHDIRNRRYDAPQAQDEVGVAFEGDDGNPPVRSELRVYYRNSSTRLTTLHIDNPSADPMCYPLIFPYGESGWAPGIPYNTSRVKKRANISRLEYIIYRSLSIRSGFNPILSVGKLTQQYIVDAYVKVEANRLSYLRENQVKLRAHHYIGLHDFLANAAELANVNVGRTVILPSTFVGGPRSMQQHFQDAMAIVAKYGRPDFFITFTCNPKWSEIVDNVNSWEEAHNRVDLICRVFHQKLIWFLEDLTNPGIFGQPLAYVYVVEFQKRGLPHCHLLLTVKEQHKPREPEHIDRLVRAEIPDKDADEVLFECVRKHMIHGPCGNVNPMSVCMVDGSCSKQFPKNFAEKTKLDDNNYPAYKRPKNERTTTVKRGNRIYEVDNSYVVPYNVWLLKRYDSHINVEVCTSVKSVKYVFKYVCKGHDCALLKIDVSSGIYDETTNYVDTRYVGASEACWRLFSYPLHGTSHVIVRLPIHLPGEKTVYFREGQLEEVLEISSERNSMFEAWFELNRADVHARRYLYVETPLHYRFDSRTRQWIGRRKSMPIISRMYTVSPKQTELFYLRMLLLHVRGPKSYEDVRTVNGNVCATFFQAARERNLLGDDVELIQCLNEAASIQMPNRLRKLFVCVLSFCVVNDPASLYAKFKARLYEDFVRRGNAEEVAEQKALAIIKRHLEYGNISYEVFGLPSVTSVTHVDDYNDITENSTPDVELQMLAVIDNKARFTEHQSSTYERIMRAVRDETDERLFFLDGPGGTGKTFLYNTLLQELKCRKEFAIAVAWTGIAAILLEGGRTVHSRFRLPFNIRENASSSITAESEEAEEIRRAVIVVWDEITMCTVHAFNAVDRLLQDVMRDSRPFGNKVILVGGDFRQCLPVVPRGHRSKIVETCVINAAAWTRFIHLRLSQNMRANRDEQSFCRWLLQLGNGELSSPFLRNADDAEYISVPSECIVRDIVTAVYGDVAKHSTEDLASLTSRIILSPKNEACDRINDRIVEKLPGDKKQYFSADKLVTDDEQEIANFPVEFLNSVTSSGLPPHNLSLKIGVPVMLLRNISIRDGLCNGTRLTVTALSDNLIEGEIITGQSRGSRVFIPRMDLTSDETSLPFVFTRRQFPLRVCFAMTINKAQGQTFETVGIYLPYPVFAHGQLYVAFSRARSMSSVKVELTHSDVQGQLVKKDNRVFTKNVVYKSLLSRFV